MEQHSLDNSMSVYSMVCRIFLAHCWDQLLRKKHCFQNATAPTMHLVADAHRWALTRGTLRSAWSPCSQHSTLSVAHGSGSHLNFQVNFHVFSLKKYIWEAPAALDGDPSTGSGQSELKTFRNGATIPDAIGNMCNSWEEVKISTPPGYSKRSIPTLKLTEGFKPSARQSLHTWSKQQENWNYKSSPDTGTESCNLGINMNGWGLAP